MSTSTSPRGPIRIAYGSAPQQFGDLFLPIVDTGATPSVVVLVHGGFWRNTYGLDLMVPLANDLAARGYAVWNIEYRRIGDDGGGYPGTLADVAAAIDDLDAISRDHPMDLDHVAVVGHSAGGHLALWAAGRSLLEGSDPGARPEVAVTVAVGLGPMVDLAAGARDEISAGAVTELLGGSPSEVPDHYRVATPRADAPAHLVVVRGGDDDIVPAEYTIYSPSGPVDVVDVPGEDHFDLIDPASASWAAVLAVLPPTG